MIKRVRAAGQVGSGLVVGALIALASQGAVAQEAVKIGLIDVNDDTAVPFQFVIDEINAAGGVLGGKHLELVTFKPGFDVQRSVDALQQAIAQGIPFVAMGSGSHIALALSEAASEHNRTHPDSRVLYLNHGAIDPALTNDKCSFWHFRFDADVDMKMAAITTYLADHQDQTEKVFLIDQDYSFGHSFATAARRQLHEKAPGIEIVGDEFHPLQKIEDFAPYVDKIKASGADSVVTGDWGNDLALLTRAGAEGGLDVNWYTFYADSGDVVRALGQKGVGRAVKVSVWHQNVDNKELLDRAAAFKQKYGADWSDAQIRPMMEMLARAIDTAGTPDPLEVALALEDMRHDTPLGEVHMRADNHQLIQPLYLSVLADDVPNRIEDTGFGFKTLAKIPAEQTVTETTCKMERPS
jgi:branched-chain amino acid transport system substrate-binding protein